MLLEAGADTGRPDNFGAAPLALACSQDRCLVAQWYHYSIFLVQVQSSLIQGANKKTKVPVF